MAHDYATRRRAGRKNAPRSVSAGPFWLITGVCLGLFLAFLLQLGGISLAPGHTGAAGQPGPLAATTAESAAQPELQAGRKKPRFEFYSLLPEAEVEVLEEHRSATRAAQRRPPQETTAAAVTATPEKQYLLQAGSFKRLDDADRLRARLLLLGLDARIDKVRLNSRDFRHRVQVGPLPTRPAMLAAQQQLTRAGIDTLLLERPSPQD